MSPLAVYMGACPFVCLSTEYRDVAWFAQTHIVRCCNAMGLAPGVLPVVPALCALCYLKGGLDGVVDLVRDGYI